MNSNVILYIAKVWVLAILAVAFALLALHHGSVLCGAVAGVALVVLAHVEAPI